MSNYKITNKLTGEEIICKKVTLYGSDYYYIDECIPYNPDGGTDGNFICLDEIRDNENHGVVKGEFSYIPPFVENVGQCNGCRKLIATTDVEMKEIPQIQIEYPTNCCISKEGETIMNKGCSERNRCVEYKIN